MIRLPRRFTVMGQPFKVEVVPGDNVPGNWVDGQTGEVRYPEQAVTLLRGQAPHSEMDTYLHEVLHVVAYLSGAWRLLQDDETVIHILAPQLLDFIRSNPQVVAYLTQKVA